MRQTVQGIFAILTRGERRRALWVTVLMALLAVIEVTGILSVTPFLAVLGNPNIVHTSKRLAPVYNWFHFTQPQQFILLLGVVSFVVLSATSAVRAFVQYAKMHFANTCRHDISMRLMRMYVRQPYSFFLRANSSKLSNMALSEVDHFIMSALMPLAQLFSYGFVTGAICLLLLFVSWKLALLVTIILGAFYGIVFWRLGALTKRLGYERKVANMTRYQITGEIMGGIKELKVLGRTDVYLQAFERPSAVFARTQTVYQTLSDVPRYMVETLGFCALFIVVFYAVHANLDLGRSLPLIGLYAFAGYRLLPAAQNIYASLSGLRYSASVVASLGADLARPVAAEESHGTKLTLTRGVTLRDVTFTYPEAERPTLAHIEVTLPAFAAIGVVGATGAGKSTLVDLCLGILTPTAGEIRIDDTALSPANARAWQDNIGYVPQAIFLADDTVARNIAFGVPDAEIDRAAVERAARLAQIHEFVTSDLPQGYETVVGERGVRLSGGQRQRLGIARALYHNPDVLIFDEATSALDLATERDLMNAIESLFGKKTVLMIAHRRDTLDKCDMLLHLENGGVRLERRKPDGG